MLTSKLVTARVQKGKLVVRALDRKRRARLLPIVEHYLAVLRGAEGRVIDEVNDDLQEVEIEARDRRMADGLKKLLLDRVEVGMPPEVDPPALRHALFTRAAEVRKASSDQAPFDREAVLAEVAAALEITVELLEDGLFADLKKAQRVLSFTAIEADALLDGFDVEQAKAVLLKATRIVVDVQFATAGAARTFFRKLKFRRLLFRIARRPDAGYRVEIDGPMNLFQASTKYGLQLALILPTLYECAHFELEADIKWFRDKDPVSYSLSGGAGPDAAGPRSRLPDDVQRLVTRFRKLKSEWEVSSARRILDLRGIGLCVPDLEFKHPESGLKVHLEVMGYWSRNAVIERVKLVEAGLTEPVIFALSSRLRVSEKMLDDALPGELYVYKGVMSAKAVLERLEARRALTTDEA